MKNSTDDGANEPCGAPLFQQDRILGNTFVRGMDFRTELESTNDWALKLAQQTELALPWLVLAERQSAGRGRGVNRWWSTTGALTFSLLLDARALRLPVERRSLVSLASGLGVCRALAERHDGLPIGVKWPNDIYVDSQKLCGILVEVPARCRDVLVLGIGINVNNSFADAPADVRSRGTSLVDVLGVSQDLTQVLIDVLNGLKTEYETLADEPDTLAERWNERCVLQGRAVCLDLGVRQVTGECCGIDSAGALMLETVDGTERFHSGTVVRFD